MENLLFLGVPILKHIRVYQYKYKYIYIKTTHKAQGLTVREVLIQAILYTFHIPLYIFMTDLNFHPNCGRKS